MRNSWPIGRRTTQARSTRSIPRHKNRRRCLLRLEQLESRRLLAIDTLPMDLQSFGAELQAQLSTTPIVDQASID